MIREIEFRSDTMTKPTMEMRKAMFNAVVGDDGYGLDPTVKGETPLHFSFVPSSRLSSPSHFLHFSR